MNRRQFLLGTAAAPAAVPFAAVLHAPHRRGWLPLAPTLSLSRRYDLIGQPWEAVWSWPCGEHSALFDREPSRADLDRAQDFAQASYERYLAMQRA